MGLRPTNRDEKPGFVGRAFLPADWLSSQSSRLDRRLRPGMAALHAGRDRCLEVRLFRVSPGFCPASLN